MSLSSLSTSRPVTVLMFYIGVVMLGVIVFFHLSVDFVPIPKRAPTLPAQDGKAQTWRGTNPSDDSVMSEIANHYCKPKVQTKIAKRICLTVLSSLAIITPQIIKSFNKS